MAVNLMFGLSTSACHVRSMSGAWSMRSSSTHTVLPRSVGRRRGHEASGVDRGSRGSPHLVEGHLRRELTEHEAVRRDVEHREIGDHLVDDALAGERERAMLQELVAAVLGNVLHEDDDA